VVVDPSARLYGGEYLTMQLGYDRRAHPIVGPLEAPPLFSLTRSVDRIAEEIPGTWFTALLRTGPDSWATTDLSVVRTGAGVFVAGRDRRGPVTVGAEVEFTVPSPTGGEVRAGRLVVYGNAEFANNFFIEYLGNKDLFVNTVAWLARDPDVMAHRSARQEPGRNQFFLTAAQGDRVFWVAAVAEPLVFALVGIGLILRRRFGG
jgi:gliding motility-associatede transport system auxiliary component